MHRDHSALVYQETGFGAFHAVPHPPSGHVHDTFEIGVFEGGCVTMLYGGRALDVPPDRLVVHWGMLPHQMLRREPGAKALGLHLPLEWVLQWPVPEPVRSRLLDLEVIVEPPCAEPCSDLARFREWHRLLAEGGALAVEIVAAEVRGRLLRLSGGASAADSARRPEATAISRALRHIVRHFREPLRIAAVARAAGLSPRHLTRVFRAFTGQGINDYVGRLRLSHARRLLTTTDAKILDIMHDAGFSCPTAFYARFLSETGLTPRAYRLRSSLEFRDRKPIIASH